MAEAVVSSVLESLADLIAEETTFLIGFRDRVERVRFELEMIRSFLKDADAYSRQGDERVRHFVSEIAEVALDLEDVIATFAMKVSYRKKSRIMNTLNRLTCFLKERVDYRKFDTDVRDVVSRISELRERFQAYGLLQLRQEGTSETSLNRVGERGSHFLTLEDDLVGFDKDIKRLVAFLTEDSRRVVAICGMGGLGKTSMARVVYQHHEVKKYFDCCAWVTISQPYQVRDILEKILFQFTFGTKEQHEENRKMSDVQEIAGKLYRIQKERRCLVILDDIWTIGTWGDLKSAFPRDGNSKILLTTRLKEVAYHVGRDCLIYEPQLLDQDESWDLLMRKARLGNSFFDKKENRTMELIARKMVQNCAGLPLAINVLGGLLSTKQHTVLEWEKLHRNVKTYAGKGKVHGGEQWIYPELSWVLGLSYDDLPYHLKSCFLHLAHFPVDYEIRVKELCRIWAAEGFVGFRPKGDSGNTAEDIAYDCLNELVERYMVHVKERGSTGRIKTCNINLVMRDLCLSKAAELNFVEIIDFHNRDEAHLTGIARRLAVYMDDDANQLLTLINSVRRGNVRSLICFNTPLTRCDQALKPMFNSFPLLKVLKFGNLGRVKVPKEIGRLFHLRFLSFKGSHVENLPSSIANLRCLQTLDLRTELRLEFPNVKWKSEQLEHIYLPRDTYSVHDNSLWLANPSRLQTLVNISTDRFSLKNVSELINLTKLDLLLCRSSDNLEEIFGHKSIKFDRLCSLSVYIELEFLVDITPIILGCPRMLKLSIHGKILKLPEDIPPSLIKLTLHNTSLQVDPMAGLEKLQNLKILHLESVDLMGNGMICSEGGFPQLETLSFCHVYNFHGWRMEEGALPRLYRLQIENCSDLKILPDGLRYVETLHDISIKEMSSNFIMRIMKGGEDFYKVLHVPVIVFDSSLSDLSTP